MNAPLWIAVGLFTIALASPIVGSLAADEAERAHGGKRGQAQARARSIAGLALFVAFFLLGALFAGVGLALRSHS